MLEIQGLDFILFLFSLLFYFSQSILFLELGLGISEMSQVTVTLSHNHMLWWKMIEDSRRNNVILYIIYIVVRVQDSGL